MVYQRIRIPQTPRRTWFRRRSAGYKVKSVDDPGPRARRLRGRGHGRGLREEMEDQIRIRRSRVRWALLVATWGALFWAALLHPLHRKSVLHFAVLVLAFVAWPATFSLSRANRGLAAFLLLVASVAYVLADGALGPGIAAGLASLGLLAAAIHRGGPAT